MPSGLRSLVPAKMTSSILPPRSVLALCSPSTQLTPSRRFDLPQPFGPTTTAIPWPGTCTSVRSQNDLNPRIWIFFSFNIVDNHSFSDRREIVFVLRNACKNAIAQGRQGQHGTPYILWISCPKRYIYGYLVRFSLDFPRLLLGRPDQHLADEALRCLCDQHRDYPGNVLRLDLR